MNIYTIGLFQTILAAIICNQKDLESADARIRSYIEFNDAVLSGEYESDQHGYEVARTIITNMDHNQYENFKQGYDLAIEKYGLEEGLTRIKNKLISVIMTHGMYESEQQMLSSCRKAYVQADIMINGGIHIDGGDTNV